MLWERTLPNRDDSKWDFTRMQPDVVIIDLGTNDFAPENPDNSPFGAAYLALLRRVRSVYPNAFVLCAVSPTLSDVWPPGAQTRPKAMAGIQSSLAKLAELGEKRLRLVEHAVVP